MNAPRVPRGRRDGWPALVPLLGLVAVWPLLTQSLPSTDDGMFHLLRLAQIDRCLRHGVLPLRWAPDMAHGYGYPFYNFYASLSSYIAELWRLIGLTIPQAVAAATVCAYWVSGWGAYLLGRESVGLIAKATSRAGGKAGPWDATPGDATPTLASRLAGLLAATAYMYAPYQFIDSAYRGNLAETWALALLPWVFWTARRAACLPRVRDSRSAAARRWARIVPLALCYAALVYTHNVYALISSPALGLYLALLWWRENRGAPPAARAREGLRLAAGIGLGLALSAFFWLPAFGERGWTRYSPGLVDYRTFFLTLRELLALPPQLDLSRLNPYPPRSLSWGAIALAGAALGLLVARALGSRRSDRGTDRAAFPFPWETLFFLVLAAGAAFLSLRAADPLWRAVPLLVYAQIPWRFLGIASLCGGLVAATLPALLLSQVRAKAAGLIATGVTAAGIVLLIATAIPWTYAAPFPQRAEYGVRNILAWEYKTGLIGTTAQTEFLPTWAGGLPSEPADPRLLEEGDAIAARLDAESLPEGARIVEADYGLMRAELVLDSPQPFRARYKQFYFPGWKVLIDGREVPQVATAPYGLLGFDVPAGRHTIVVRPSTTPLRLAGNLISGLALVVVVALGSLARCGKRGCNSPVARADVGRPPSAWLFFAGLALLALLAKEGRIDRTENAFRARRYDASVPGGNIPGTRFDTAINYGNAYTLYGYDLPRRPTVAGEPLRVDLYVGARADRPNGDYRAYARLVDEQGALWSLPDNSAPEGHRPPPPTSAWPTDAYGHWANLVQTLPGTPPGTYWIQVGLFEDGTWAGLNVLDEGGQIVGLSTRFGPVEIARPRQAPGIETLDLDETLSEIAAPGLRLLGAKIEQAPQRAGDTLSLALYWRAEAAMTENYCLTLALHSGDQRLVLGDPLPLGRTDHPTGEWIEGEVVRSAHTLRVPAAAPGGAYTICATVRDTTHTVAGGELQEIEREWSAPPDVLPVDADLGGQARLVGYTLSPAEGETLFAPGSRLTVTLYWQAEREMPVSYKAFVQWIGAGQALAQDDAVPGGWQRPTTGWVPGEVVADAHALTLPEALAPGEYALIAGMYDETTLLRLPLLDASGAEIGDHVLLERREIK